MASAPGSPPTGRRTAADVDNWGGDPVVGIPIHDDFSAVSRTPSQSPPSAQSTAPSSSPPRTSSNVTVLKVEADDLAVMAQTFQISEKQVLAVWQRAGGDRETAWRLLQEGSIPSERDAAEALKKVTIQRNTITISRQELVSLADMFGLPQERVLAIIRMENGNMDAALKWLSQESCVGSKPLRHSSPPQPAKQLPNTVHPAALPPTELQAYVEMFHLDAADVVAVWNDCAGDRDKVLRDLEFLASTRASQPPAVEVLFDDEANVELIPETLPQQPQQPSRHLPASPGLRETGDSTVSPGRNSMLPPMPPASSGRSSKAP